MSYVKEEEVRDTALKLNEIRARCPEEYFYIKGWIHCLLQKEGILEDKKCELPKQFI